MHARRRGLPVLLSLALTSGLVAVGSPARAADPTTFALDVHAIWAGQQVVLTESGPDDTIRTVTWGDGNTDSLAAGVTTLAHTYNGTGAFTVGVALSDGTAGTFPTGAAVGVDTVPGSYGWQKPTIYTYPGYQEQGTMVASSMPGGANRIWTNWPDGEVSLLKTGTSTQINHWFGEGTWSGQISGENTHGRSVAQSSSPLTVLPDTTAPWIGLTVPATPHAKASWSTIRGKTYDSQSGPDGAYLQAWAYNNTSIYYLNFVTRAWVAYNGGTPPDAALAYAKADASGAWSYPALGPNKGFTFEVDYLPMDKVGNVPEDANGAKWSIASWAITS